MSNSSRNLLRDHHHLHNHYPNPSFSSTLLEEIYRSIDHDSHYPHNPYLLKKHNDVTDKTYLNKHNNSDVTTKFIDVDRWIDQHNQKLNLRRYVRRPENCASSTSSSDSSLGFDSEKPRRKSPELKPIRTTSERCSDEIPGKMSKKKKKKKSEGSSSNLQRKAMKFYGDLKKVKQPISPGGKLATFLSSVFTSAASKKPKIASSFSSSSSSYTPSSTVSQSCLSKTPSSAGRFERRSVRFAGVDMARCDSSRMDVEVKLRSVEEMLRNYRNNRKEILKDSITVKKIEVKTHEIEYDNYDVDEDEDEDDVSCCSSDLFELENLLDIGDVERYREELPVYETTSFVDTKRAITNGFIL